MEISFSYSLEETRRVCCQSVLHNELLIGPVKKWNLNLLAFQSQLSPKSDFIFLLQNYCLYIFCLLDFFFFFLVALCGMQDLSFPTRRPTHNPIGSLES